MIDFMIMEAVAYASVERDEKDEKDREIQEWKKRPNDLKAKLNT